MSLADLKYEGRVRFTHDDGVAMQTFEYELHDISVRSAAQIIRFELMNSSLLQLVEPAYLRFDLSFVKMRRVTGTGLSAGGDFIYLYNLFLGNKVVNFIPYPISVPTLSFDVLWDSPEIPISTFTRGRQVFPRSFSLITRTAITSIPTAFRALPAVAPGVLNQHPSPKKNKQHVHHF